MREWILIVLVFLVVTQGTAQPKTNGNDRALNLGVFLLSDSGDPEVPAAFQKLVTQLDSRRSNWSDDRFIAHVFSKTHRHLLKNYRSDASFVDLLETGDYNCLTGTGLYAILLDYFDIPYTITETNYHIFLIAETNSGRYLFEATDPLGGFLAGGRLIDSRIEEYRQTDQELNAIDGQYEFRNKIFNTVSLVELAGLLFYNQAVNAYNNHQLEMAVDFLDTASQLYYSTRIEEMSQLILGTITGIELEAAQKEALRSKLTAMSLKRNGSLRLQASL